MRSQRSRGVLAALVIAMAVGTTVRVTASATAPSSCAATIGSNYSVTTCITQPASTLTGAVQIQATVTVNSGKPNLNFVSFFLCRESGSQGCAPSQYILASFRAPYQFQLPTQMWVDGTYVLGAAPIISSKRGSMAVLSTAVLFSNGVTTAPTPPCCRQPVTGTLAPPNSFVVAAVGDGASGTPGSDPVTALIQLWNPNLFLYLGDVYQEGTYTEYYNYWAAGNPTPWSSFDSIADPVIGNHEGETPLAPGEGGGGYEFYWSSLPLYYSFNAGGWHFIALDGNPKASFSASEEKAQLAWLQSDLASNTDPCIIAYWHQPYWDDGPAGSSAQTQQLWTTLAKADATLVLNGHDHTYQHWVPMDANGNATTPPNFGTTEIINGTGGHDLANLHPPFSPNDPTHYSGIAGVLKLTLTINAIDFQFVDANSGTVMDSGTINAPPGAVCQ